MDWRPVDYLFGTLTLNEVDSDLAILRRLPRLNPPAEAQPILPDYDVHLGRLDVRQFRFGAGVAGRERVGRLHAEAQIRSGRALLALDLAMPRRRRAAGAAGSTPSPTATASISTRASPRPKTASSARCWGRGGRSGSIWAGRAAGRAGPAMPGSTFPGAGPRTSTWRMNSGPVRAARLGGAGALPPGPAAAADRAACADRRQRHFRRAAGDRPAVPAFGRDARRRARHRRSCRRPLSRTSASPPC